MAQSIVPSSTIATRRWSCGISRGWTVSPRAALTWDLGDPLDHLLGDGGVQRDRELAFGRSAVAGAGVESASRTSAKTFSSWSW